MRGLLLASGPPVEQACALNTVPFSCHKQARLYLTLDHYIYIQVYDTRCVSSMGSPLRLVRVAHTANTHVFQVWIALNVSDCDQLF